MTELLSLYFDIISKNSPWNPHQDVDLLLRLKKLVDHYSSTSLSLSGDAKSADILEFLKQYNTQIKSATNDAVEANAVQRLLRCRDTYETPYVHPSLENRSTTSLMSRIESAAKELGLEAFQDQSVHGDVTVHTVTIAGTILVIDVDLTSSPEHQSSLTRLKTSYATNSNTTLEPIDKLLIKDLDEFVAPNIALSSTESVGLRCERAFQRFKRNLHQLVLLDKLSQRLGNQNDLFVSYESLVKAFGELCSAENSSIPQPKHLHLYPSLDIHGHGLTLNHSIRPYLTQVLHVSSRNLFDPAQAIQALSHNDTCTIHVELRESLWPFNQPFPSKVQPTFKKQAPANANLQVLPGSEKAITAYACLSKDLYLPRSACMAIQAALGYSDNMQDDHKLEINWLDCIYQRLLQTSVQPVTQSLAGSRSQLYTMSCSEDRQSMEKVLAVPFRTFAELLRIIEIIKEHLFFEELLVSCLHECELANGSNSQLSVSVIVKTEPLSIEVNVDDSLIFTVTYEENEFAIKSNTLDDDTRLRIMKVITRTRSIPITVFWLTNRLDKGK